MEAQNKRPTTQEVLIAFQEVGLPPQWCDCNFQPQILERKLTQAVALLGLTAVNVVDRLNNTVIAIGGDGREFTVRSGNLEVRGLGQSLIYARVNRVGCYTHDVYARVIAGTMNPMRG